MVGGSRQRAVEPVGEGHAGRRGPVGAVAGAGRAAARRARSRPRRRSGRHRRGPGDQTGRVRAGSMASQAAIRAEAQPVRRPACRAAVANAASSGGPDRVGRGPAVRDLVRLTGVEADLQAGGAVHHRAAGRAAPVEGAAHRAVAGGVHHRAGPSVRVDAAAAEDQPGGGQQVGDLGDVGLGGADQRGDRGAGRGGDLQLATRLDGDRAAVSQRRGRAGGIQGGGAVPPQRRPQPRRGRRGGRGRRRRARSIPVRRRCGWVGRS